jgi:hypothetical protein
VLLLAERAVRRGAVRIEGLVVEAADLRGRAERPHGFGVDAMQGGLTIWNRQHDPDVVLHAEIRGVSAGSLQSPIRGSGLFVAGRGDDNGRPSGGSVLIPLLETGEIVIDGGIAVGAPDLISGGVFVQTGARVESVANNGPVTTLGPNDMALDNWGQVERWTCTGPVTTRGPSGIGFVNFGALGELDVQAPIQTFGVGARGFNLYDGALSRATFESISTHADGAVGIQIARPLTRLTIRSDLTTMGGEGISLVRGQQVRLQAIALSVKRDGHIDQLTVGRDVRTTGDRVASLEVLGPIDRFELGGIVVAEGSNSDAAHVAPEHSHCLGGIQLRARRGRRLVQVDE